MDSSEKIPNNCDVLHSIFRYLNLNEHLKLLKIFSQFEYICILLYAHRIDVYDIILDRFVKCLTLLTHAQFY